jgi:hypothetical protein
MNSVQLSGRVVGETKMGASGKWASVGVNVPEYNSQTKAFDQNVQNITVVGEYSVKKIQAGELPKGTAVELTGRIVTKKSEKDGKYYTSIICGDIRKVPTNAAEKAAATTTATEHSHFTTEEIPF